MLQLQKQGGSIPKSAIQASTISKNLLKSDQDRHNEDEQDDTKEFKEPMAVKRLRLNESGAAGIRPKL